jgi:alpha/beta superfamily hydrolase
MARLEERMVAIGCADGSLEGVFRPGADAALRGAVVAPPHPLYGGSLESPVVNELSWACAKHGVPSLCFNWRGVGASSGQSSGEADDADADYAAALSHMAETVAGPILACGYSFGAAAAVRAAAHPRVDRVILVAPPPALVSPEAIARLGCATLVVTGALDELAPPRAISEALLDAPGVTFEAIPKTDHFFMAGLAAVGELAQAWLQADGGEPLAAPGSEGV